MENRNLECSFCGKQITEVKRLTVGAEGSICDYCIVLMYITLEKEGVDLVQLSEKVKRDLAKLEPR